MPFCVDTDFRGQRMNWWSHDRRLPLEPWNNNLAKVFTFEKPRPPLVVLGCYFRTWTPDVTTGTWLRGIGGLRMYGVTSLAESSRRLRRPLRSPLPNLKRCLCERYLHFSKSPQPINLVSAIPQQYFYWKLFPLGRLPCSFSFYYVATPQWYLERRATCVSYPHFFLSERQFKECQIMLH